MNKLKNRLCLIFVKSLVLIAITSPFPSVHAAEEEFTLEEVKESAPAPANTSMTSLDKLKIMGRVDLTSEISPYKDKQPLEEHEFKSYHFLIFLKVKASEKTHFFGELIDQAFYFIEHQPSDTWTVSLGKIPVPFGDNRQYHHFYGGVQGMGGTGIMLPNVWSEHGVQLNGKWNSGSIDLYSVNGFTSLDAAGRPETNKSSDGSKQAFGLRVAQNLFLDWTAWASALQQEWQDRDTLSLLGLDISTGYKLMRYVRWGAGVGQATVMGHADDTFRRTGDYVYLATPVIPKVETLIRYGTYIHDDRDSSQLDTHALSAALRFSVDQIRMNVEYQWNFEAVDEIENDLFRIMAALDF